MKEVWKTIEGFENYQISNFGRVKSLKYNKEKILKNRITHYGYLTVLLSGEIMKTFFVHRLIAIYFIENKENKPCVNHINGIKTDNRVNNLEWVTYRENSLHAYGLGLNKRTWLGKYGTNHGKHLSYKI